MKKAVIASNVNVTKFNKQMNLSRLVVTIMEAFSQYGIIIFYLLGVEWSSINLATITEITATLLIIETALGQISRIAETLNSHSERLTVLEREENDMSLILEIYNKESEKISKPKKVDNILLNSFTIHYLEASEN